MLHNLLAIYLANWENSRKLRTLAILLINGAIGVIFISKNDTRCIVLATFTKSCVISNSTLESCCRVVISARAGCNGEKVAKTLDITLPKDARLLPLCGVPIPSFSRRACGLNQG